MDGTLKRHPRINTVESAHAIIRDKDGPTLLDALTVDNKILQKTHLQMKQLPKTEEEKQRDQLEAGIALFNGIEEEEEEDDDDEEEEVAECARPWDPKFKGKCNNNQYTLFSTVWCRVNVAVAFLKKDHYLFSRVHTFVAAHKEAIMYLDSLDDPRDDLIDLRKLVYTPLGPANHESDRDTFKIIKTQHKVRDTPLEQIVKFYPQKLWTVEAVVREIEDGRLVSIPNCLDDEWVPVPGATLATHKLYFACLYILQQCITLLSTDASDEVEDSLWTYYVSFVDIFFHTRDFSDKALLSVTYGLSQWEMYGSNLDTFVAGDLPNMFHVLNAIPLHGEQNTPTYTLAKIYEKALPYACKRRHFIKVIVDAIENEPAFFKFVGALFWVLLAGLYPKDMMQNRTLSSMRDLLRIKEIVTNKELLISALTIHQPGFKVQVNTKLNNANGGSLLVFVVFGMHIVYMTRFNPTFADIARRYIAWDHYVQNMVDLAEIVRDCNYYGSDPFGLVRKLLAKKLKAPEKQVHRFRRYSCSEMLNKKINETFEKVLIKDKHDRTAANVQLRLSLELDEDAKMKRVQKLLPQVEISQLDDDIKNYIGLNEEIISMYNSSISNVCKAAILNILVRIPPKERLTPLCISLLSLPQYGGVSENTVCRMIAMTQIYKKGAVPKDFTQCIGNIEIAHFAAACYYFNTVALLNKIHFVALDADTVRRTDHAMVNHKYKDQMLPRSVYGVYISLCCERVCNLIGTGKFGCSEVVYDIDKLTFLCAHRKSTKKKTKKKKEDAEFVLPDAQIEKIITENGKSMNKVVETQNRKVVRNERKLFNKIPCGQPLLCIDMRGKALVWGGRLEKLKQYMFCPECGALHFYSVLNFSGGGSYCCAECRAAQWTHARYTKCAYCTKQIPWATANKLEVAAPQEEGCLVSPQDTVQWLYFCKGHWACASRYNYRLTKDMLFKKIKKADAAKQLYHANKH